MSYNRNVGYGGPNINAPTANGASVDSPFDTVKQMSSKLEDILDTTFEPVKPCVFNAYGA
jgi:hypothetical protein